MRRDFISTYTGNKVWLPGSSPESIDIEDIAHALSHAPRFAGHTDFFYSVAQHSLNVMRLLPIQHQLQGLLHDGSEAYLCDIPTPYKGLLGNYYELEADLWRAISAKFNVPFELAQEVKNADRVMLMTERDIMKPDSIGTWSSELENFRTRALEPEIVCSIVLRDPAEVKREFLEAFDRLMALRIMP